MLPQIWSQPWIQKFWSDSLSFGKMDLISITTWNKYNSGHVKFHFFVIYLGCFFCLYRVSLGLRHMIHVFRFILYMSQCQLASSLWTSEISFKCKYESHIEILLDYLWRFIATSPKSEYRSTSYRPIPYTVIILVWSCLFWWTCMPIICFENSTSNIAGNVKISLKHAL